MSEGRIWLGLAGSEILLSNIDRTFIEEDTEILKESRAASGKLVFDIIAVKKHFEIDYVTVTDDVLETLKQIYSYHDILSLKIERKNGTVDTYSVRLKPFSRKRVLTSKKEWLWGDIKLILDEI